KRHKLHKNFCDFCAPLWLIPLYMRFAVIVVVIWLASSAFAAPITLRVDATEAPRKIYHAELNIPATPGPMTLYYPKWIPGDHAPTGPINDLAGLRISA